MREFQCPTDVAKTYRPLRCWIRQGIRANMYGVIVTVFIVCSFFFHLLQKLCPVKFENALSVVLVTWLNALHLILWKKLIS